MSATAWAVFSLFICACFVALLGSPLLALWELLREEREARRSWRESPQGGVEEGYDEP